MSWLLSLAAGFLLAPLAFSRHVAESPSAPYRFALGLLLFALAFLVGLRPASAQSIPDSAAMYRRMVDAAVIEVWGNDDRAALTAAQMHKESTWRAKVTSAAGARGMAQFMPATAKWIAQEFPEQLGAFDPWDPQQAILAAAVYDRYLYDRVTGASECDRWAFALSAYNGGLGWTVRDRNRASATGADPARWFGHVELHSARAKWARVENRDYVQKILLVLEPLYLAAGWSGTAVCP